MAPGTFHGPSTLPYIVFKPDFISYINALWLAAVSKVSSLESQPTYLPSDSIHSLTSMIFLVQTTDLFGLWLSRGLESESTGQGVSFMKSVQPLHSPGSKDAFSFLTKAISLTSLASLRIYFSY